MKKLAIILSAVVAVALLAALAIPQGSMTRGGTDGPITYYVVASDAPGNFRRGGPNTRLCSGADDHVQIQWAIDQASAAGTLGGGRVELSPGIFSVDKPAGAVDIDGTCVLYTVGSTSTCTGLVTYAQGTHADVAIGMNFRLEGGDDGEGETLESNNEPMIPTVTAKTGVSAVTVATWDDSENQLTETAAFANAAIGDWIYISGGTNVTVGWHQIATVVDDDNVTITATEVDDGAGDLAGGDITSSVALLFSEPIQEAYGVGAATDVNFDRIIGSIVLKPQVTLRGAGIDATQIKLETSADCTVIVSEPSSQEVYFSIRELSIHGNRANQGDKTAANFNGLYNGIVFSDLTWDVSLQDVAVWQCKGDGVWFDQPWGLRWYGGWVEFCTGAGVTIGEGAGAWIGGVKIAENNGKTTDAGAGNGALNLYHTRYSYINPRLVGTLSGSTDWALKLKAATNNTLTGITIHGNTSAAGCLYIGHSASVSTDNVVMGCHFNTVSNKGIELTEGSTLNTLVGNTFNSTATPALTVGGTIAALSINGNIRLVGGNERASYNDQSRAADSAVVPAAPFVKVVGTPGAVTLSSAPSIADGAYDGQPLTIMGTHDTSTVTINDNTNCQLTGGAAAVLGKGDFVSLVWDVADSDWYESGRSID